MAHSDYNWIDDPFDEKKAQASVQQSMTGASKLAVLLGCLGVVIVLLVLVALAFLSLATLG